MKRLFDIILAFSGILLFLPFGIILSIILLITGEHEIFYFQDRIGQYGETFKCIKFTTMVKNSQNMGTGDITIKNDPRVLPIGKVLRKTKINEVPQLINIFMGDMSFIGPRPLTKKTFDFYPDESKDYILKLKPGLSGAGSVIFRDEEEIIGKSNMSYEECYRNEIMPYKAKLERWYLENQSIGTDLKLFFLTIVAVIFPTSKIYKKVFKNIPLRKDYN